MKSHQNKGQFVLVNKKQLEALLYSYHRDNVLANTWFFEDDNSIYSETRDEYVADYGFHSLDELVKNKQFTFIISDTFVGPIYETKELAEQTRNCFTDVKNIFVLSLEELNVLVFSYYRDEICEEIREQFDVAYEEESEAENYFEHLSEMSGYDIESYEDLIKLEFESEEAKTVPLPFFRETFIHVNEAEQNGNPSQSSDNGESVVSNNLFLLRCNKIY